MRVEQLGDGEPELAILSAIHGDEPCGTHAIETLLDEEPDVEQPIKCIIANERALEQDKRYIETDLNRTFPGDPTAEAYESRLAYELVEELRGCTTLSMHSTQSYGGAFALVNKTGPLAKTICPALSIDAIVEAADEFPHALVNHVDVIEVECGIQGSEQATENATRIVREFLSATDAASDTDEPTEGTVPIYQIDQLIPKPAADTYTIQAENFEQVTTGEPYATVDGQSLTAAESFYPVLMSADGYKSQFGYTAELIDHLRRN